MDKMFFFLALQIIMLKIKKIKIAWMITLLKVIAYLTNGNCSTSYPCILSSETHMEAMLIHNRIFLIRPSYRDNQRKIIQNP